MKSELLAADISAKQTAITTVSAQLLARGSGARPGYYLWCMRQRGSRVDIRTQSGWTEVIKGDALEEQNSVEAATAAAAPLTLPGAMRPAAEQAIDCMHAIRANPGSRDGCTSNTLDLPGRDDLAWQEMSPDTMELPSPCRIEQLVPCGDRLYALALSNDSSSPYEQCIFAATRQTQPQWQETPPPPVFAAGNRISHLVSFCERLYAAVDDETGGFQLWQLDEAAGWIRIVDRGGQEHSASARVTAVYSDSQCMLIACAPCDELARLEENAPGPELILVRPDNSWDLVVGTTRVTPGGLVVPGSLMGRGFDNTTARQIASITRCGATYYISVVVAARQDKQLRGEVWHSDDLESWSTVSLPAEITALDATLVSALGNPSATLLVLKRQPGADSAQQASSSPPEIPGLLRDVEFWLLPAGA